MKFQQLPIPIEYFPDWMREIKPTTKEDFDKIFLSIQNLYLKSSSGSFKKHKGFDKFI